MHSCWNIIPIFRPAFKEICQQLDDCLKSEEVKHFKPGQASLAETVALSALKLFNQFFLHRIDLQ